MIEIIKDNISNGPFYTYIHFNKEISINRRESLCDMVLGDDKEWMLTP